MYKQRTLRCGSRQARFSLAMQRIMPVAFTFMLAVMLPSHALAAGLFNYLEFKASRLESIPKWVEVLGRVKAEWPQLEDCAKRASACVNRPQKDWRDAMLRWKSQGVNKRVLDDVNRFFNAYTYITDSKLLGMSDYWQTPTQFLARSGDCEDYSIAKFFTLKALGFSPDNLRIVVVHDAVRDIAHAVLAVKMDGEEYILDNLTTTPLAARFVFQYTPYYAVNETYRWVFVKSSP
ncbi:MAG: hypothetical protein COY40_00545 [Alphaproteobacteria bacterium CG_4_10_14_0_8_um_filter_53_9]|nr:MAG: hypothetical protein COY40_00545 [Alphaproteobacteria bacterium CG_4_10_14_0_8_um_filter_53_9]